MIIYSNSSSAPPPNAPQVSTGSFSRLVPQFQTRNSALRSWLIPSTNILLSPSPSSRTPQEQGARRTGEQTSFPPGQRSHPLLGTAGMLLLSLLVALCVREESRTAAHPPAGRLVSTAAPRVPCGRPVRGGGLRRGFPFHRRRCLHQPTQPSLPVGPAAVLAQLFVQLCGRPDGRSDSGWKEKHVAFCRVF